MPVLMNKGDNPREAAWLFYSNREALDAWGRAIAEGRYDSGMLVCDAADVEAAKKASSEVPVYLEVKTLVPEDFDIEAARGEIMDRASAALERLKQQAEEDAGEAEKPEAQAEDGGDAEDGGEDDPLDYEPVPAPEGLRIPVGATTKAAAQSFLTPRKAEGEGDAPWDTTLPSMQMLGQLIDFMRDSQKGLPAFAVWHIDPNGILRMVPGKGVKAMAGNVLNVKRA